MRHPQPTIEDIEVETAFSVFQSLTIEQLPPLLDHLVCLLESFPRLGFTDVLYLYSKICMIRISKGT